MQRMNKFARTLTMVGVLAFALGCNTLHGAGENIEQGGEAIQDAAQGDDND